MNPTTQPDNTKRFDALDGIRGVAAVIVMLSHTGFNTALFQTMPLGEALWYPLYQTLIGGAMGVQVFFVLCGFLISYLYQKVPSPWAFIQKRYARIFPLFTAIVTFIFLQEKVRLIPIPWLNALLLMLSIALVWYGCWRVLNTERFHRFTKWLFIGFFSFQILIIIFNWAITSRYIYDATLNLSPQTRDLVTFVTNLTLTVPFLNYIPWYQGPFWSLVPEVLFYISFPFLVVPLLQKLNQEKKVWIDIAVCIVICVLLYLLNDAFKSTLGLISMSIYRASGFVIGVAIGNALANKNGLNTWLAKIVHHPIGNLLAGLSIPLVFVLNWMAPPHQPILFFNFFFLACSILIGLAIYAATIPGSLTQRIFSNRLLRFWGLVSYSMYLSHGLVNHYIYILFPGAALQDSLMLNLTALIINTGVSYMLFYFLERPYFKFKKWPVEKKESKEGFFDRYPKLSAGLTFSIFAIFILSIYQLNISPSLKANFHPMTTSARSLYEIPIRPNQKITLSLQAADNYLALVTLNLRYHGDSEASRSQPKHAQLVFRMKEKDDKKWFIESKRSAFEIFGQARYPFGIAPIPDSKGKHYVIELESVGGSETDYVLLRNDHNSIVTAYQYPKSELKKPLNALSFIVNKVSFVLHNYFALLSLVIGGLLVLLYFFYPRKK